MPSRYLDEVRKPGQMVNPFFTFLGVEIQEAGPQRVVLRLACKPEFVQGAGAVAGGVVAALADEAMAHVVLANLAEGQKTATIEMTVRYFRPVLTGGLTAVAELVNKGRRIICAEAVVTDSNNRQVAKAGGSFFVLE